MGSHTNPADGHLATREQTAPPSSTGDFVAQRDQVFAVAEELLGSAVDAEDVLQETWLEWVALDADLARDRGAALLRIAARRVRTRLHSDAPSSGHPRGSWQSDYLLTPYDEAEDVALAGAALSRLLFVLNRFTPTEQAVLLLRTVFDLADEVVATAVGQDPAAVQEIVSRTRAEISSLAPTTVTSPHETREALEALRRGIETGDADCLSNVLARDVVALADAGGADRAAVRPVVGAEAVAGHVVATVEGLGGGASTEPVRINGHPALVLLVDGVVEGIVAVATAGSTITGLYYTRSPDRLLDGS